MGLPAIELTELAVPGHLGQAVGFTSSDHYRSQWSHSSLRHKNEKTMQRNEQTRAPQGQLWFINLPLQKSALSHYNKQKLAVPDSGGQLIQWIKSIYSHEGSNKRGLRQRLLHVELEDMAKERRKTSCSTSQAFFQHQARQKTPWRRWKQTMPTTGSLMELRLAQKPPSAPASGYLPQALEDGP